MPDIYRIDHAQVSRAYIELSERGLYVSTRWLAELLAVLPQKVVPESSSAYDSQWLLARSCFDTREFSRVAGLLANREDSPSIFMRLYSGLLHSEKTICDNNAKLFGKVENSELETLLTQLEDAIARHPKDGYLFYLQGVTRRKMRRAEDAIAALLNSVNLVPFNWSAWLELAACIRTRAAYEAVYHRLPNGLMSVFFHCHMLLELQINGPEMGLALMDLKNMVGRCWHTRRLEALAHYNARRFDSAMAIFDEIYANDPERLDDIDTLSHILFIKENYKSLSALAERAVKIDKFRPETCVVLGNMYGLQGDHEKALLNFRRALRLNPEYSQGWTLVGHEYVEFRNVAAAIEAYRRALDLNAFDHRAWNGLGMMYELLGSLPQAIIYYRKASEIMPSDWRILSSLARCYETHGMTDHAIIAYQNAIATEDYDKEVLLSLGYLLVKEDLAEEALPLFCTYVDKCDPNMTMQTEAQAIAILNVARAGHKSNPKIRDLLRALAKVGGEFGEQASLMLV